MKTEVKEYSDLTYYIEDSRLEHVICCTFYDALNGIDLPEEIDYIEVTGDSYNLLPIGDELSNGMLVHLEAIQLETDALVEFYRKHYFVEEEGIIGEDLLFAFNVNCRCKSDEDMLSINTLTERIQEQLALFNNKQ